MADKAIKRIVMCVGGVETLDYFSVQMGKEFERLGYGVFYLNLEDGENSAHRLRKFIRTGETAFLTFNFEGLEKETGVYKNGAGYVWDEYAVPCYNIAADHPYYYHERLADLPKKYFHLSIDKRHEAYFKEFYPEYTDAGFLPLAGTRLSDAASYEAAAFAGGRTLHEELRALAEEGKASWPLQPSAESAPEPPQGGTPAQMDVILTGNFTPTSFCTPYIHWINDEYAAFYQGIIDDLLANPSRTVEEAALEHCEREMGKNSTKDLRIALHKMIFIDIYVRNYWRGEAVRTLAEAGIRVDVFGKGWEELPCSRPENVVIHNQITSVECLRAIANAKVSLNVMPWFKDGAHDRVFNSILNGTVCVTDKSKYLCEQLKEGEGVCYYDLAQMGALPSIVGDLLADGALREEIVRRGALIVEERHTWAERARQIIELFK